MNAIIVGICILSSVLQSDKLKSINKLLKASSPYGGYVELVDGELIHHQKKNPGIRTIKLSEVEEVRYLYDRYDPNKAYYSVELVCESGECARVSWLDGEKINYNTLIFSFTSEKAAKQALEQFKKLKF